MRNLLFALLAIFLTTACEENPITGGNNDDDNNDAVVLDCDYNADITLTDRNPDGVDYIVDCDLEIRDGTFTIEAGTTIQFMEGASLSVEQGGILRARGTAGAMITMTGTEPGRSSWRGLYIYSDRGSMTLDHVLIEDAGQGEEFGVLNDNHGAITLHGSASISNCTIRNSASNGVITLENIYDARVDAFADNTITGCEDYPILVSQNHITDMDLHSCSLEQNGINMIGLHQDDSDRLTQASVFKAQKIPYFIRDGFELYAPLTIEAGVEVVMGNGAFLSTSRQNNEYLLIQGTASNRVTIRGAEAFSGYWQGIYIHQGNSLNIWEHLDISDGGGTVQGRGDLAGNITVEWDGTLTINDCTSSRSGGDCDIVLSTFIGVPELTNNSPQITNVCEE
jgi:hypothetical protein